MSYHSFYRCLAAWWLTVVTAPWAGSCHLLRSLFLLLSCVCLPLAAQRQQIDLSGIWQFALDEQAEGEQKGFATQPLSDTIVLPGTTDTNHKGNPPATTTETTRLTRRYAYVGKAWYRREVDIPRSWKGHSVVLHLERTKPTTVFIDGRKVGYCNNISTPQTYQLSAWLTPGRHTITLLIDNKQGVPPQLLTSSHAFTEDTQTNWNGVIGKLYLEAVPRLHIDSLQTVATAHQLHFSFQVAGWRKSILPVSYTISDEATGKTVYSFGRRYKNAMVCDGLSQIDTLLEQWSEFSPKMYRLTVRLPNGDTQSQTFGCVSFEAHGHHFYVNGKAIFLRGKHDACVFPLTAHVPMDTASWRQYFATLADYGINHVRFHSWCPPEACFTVADEMGFYLQPELPFWGDFNAKDTVLMNYLHREGLDILRQYGHHPSFVMMALGNELWGSVEKMQQFVADYRAAFPSKLYTLGSNFYLGYKGVQPGMDYITTCRLGGEAWGEFNTHTRGSFSFADAYDGGLLNHQYPNTTVTLEGAIGETDIPVVSHETGQFQVYPDYNEISLYKGVLCPYNLQTFQHRLQQAGMGSQAAAFHRASGLWAVELYKADMELDLRTGNMAGYQLLDLQDYPGQGSAYVGVLNAFMKSKHLVQPQRWRQWCAPIVPLLIVPRFCYTDGDSITCGVKIAHYGNTSLHGKQLKWTLTDGQQQLKGEGFMTIQQADSQRGLLDVGRIAQVARLSVPERNEQWQLTLCIPGTTYANTYQLWVYANTDFAAQLKQLTKGLSIVDTLTAPVLQQLNAGGNVLLMPRDSMYLTQTVGGLLQTDYWNYRMFKTICVNNHKPVSPGTLGLLINSEHPLFENFPTQNHTNWQWAAMARCSRPFVLDLLPEGYQPLVQVIDNVERNHRLALVFELSVGKGKLLVCMAQLPSLLCYPEARQLYLSLLRYMHTKEFAPQQHLSCGQLVQLFTEEAREANVSELKNISFE